MTVTGEKSTVIQNILRKLIEEYTPEKVILFGSYAYGDPDPDSDIDLLIIKETSDRFLDRWVTVQRILTGILIAPFRWRRL